MQAIYWVLTWACHRKCAHCYDDRFRPYVRDALTRVVAEGQHAYEKVIANLPDDMTWANPQTGQLERTLMVMAGGELLIDGVREELFYPALEAIKARWGEEGPRISIQTTGDIVTPEILDEVLARGVTTIAIASGQASCSLARRKTCGSANCGRAGERGPTACRMPDMRPISAPVGLAARTS